MKIFLGTILLFALSLFGLIFGLTTHNDVIGAIFLVLTSALGFGVLAGLAVIGVSLFIATIFSSNKSSI